MQIVIYSLTDPVTGAIRYVGKTERKPRQRLSKHVCLETDDKTHRANWIRSLLTRGFKPIIDVVEIVTEETWREREIYWIAEYRARGCDLTNTAEGGQGPSGHSPSEETRRKISLACRGIVKSAEWRLNIARALKGHKNNLGHKQSQAQIENRATWHRGRKRPQETCAAISNAKRGKKATDAARQAQSEAAKRRPTPTASACANISAALTGLKKTEEHKQKLRDIALNRTSEHKAKLLVARRKRADEVVAKNELTGTPEQIAKRVKSRQKYAAKCGYSNLNITGDYQTSSPHHSNQTTPIQTQLDQSASTV